MKGHAGHVDNILVALGPTGRYQVTQLVLALLPLSAAAFQLLSNVFTSHDVPHHCAKPPNGSDFYHQFDHLDNVSYVFDKCSIQVLSNDDVISKETCLFGNEYELPKDASAVSEFDLVCDRHSLAKLSQTLVIVGQGVGAVITTTVSDRFGRKRVLIASNLAVGVCGLVIAYSPSYAVFAAFKFILGGFQQGVVTGAFTYGVELFPANQRRVSLLMNGLIFSFACKLLALVSYLSRDLSWRITQSMYCATSLTFIISLVLSDESLRWLLANGKSHEATKIIEKAAAINKKQFADVMLAYNDDSHTKLKDRRAEVDEHVLDAETKKLTLLDILRVPRLLVNSLAIWFSWFTCALGFFAIYLASGSLSSDPFLSFFLIAVMESVSSIISYFTWNRGRKITMIIMYLSLATGLLAVGILKSFDANPVFDVLVLISFMIGMLGAGGAFMVVFAYTPEMFPTNCRNQALGVASFMGRIGGMLAPFTAVLAYYVKWGPGVVIGVCAVIVCVLMRVLPETARRELPQTLEELTDWYDEDKEKQRKNIAMEERPIVINNHYVP